MRKIPSLLPLLFLLLLFQCATLNDKEEKKIVVFGTAEKEVKPDKLIWFLNANNKNNKLEDAAEDHNRIVNQVIGFLKSIGVEQKEIQTSEMQFGENWIFMNQSQVREGYFASTNISFTNTDLEKYKDIWIGLSKIGNVSIIRTQFDVVKRIDIQNEVRKMALLKADEKAQTMANTLSMTIGKPIIIEEDQSINDRPWEGFLSNQVYADNIRSSQNASDEVIAPGRLKINARVRVEFELKKR